jgi:hypothetical protein
MTTAVTASACEPLPASGWYGRANAALRTALRRGLRFRLRCLMLGHDDSFAREPRRLMLRCAACGRETPGWPIGPDRAVPRTARPASPSPEQTVTSRSPVIRSGPWRTRWTARRDARDRQRQRLVAAASRAAEPQPDAGGARDAGRVQGRAALRAVVHQSERWLDAARRVHTGLGG